MKIYKKGDGIVVQKIKSKEPLSLKNLKCPGREIWKDIDIEEYIKKERESW